MMHDLSDDLLNSYDYRNDETLTSHLSSYDQNALKQMMGFGRGVNAFGLRFAAHQNRVAKDGAALLLALGYSKIAAHNFRAAMLYHDIGKMHDCYEPQMWTLPTRPTPDQKALQRKHAALGAQMWEEFAAGKKELSAHPHFAVRYAVTKYHHERIDGAGPQRVDAATLPVFVQVSCIVDAYDGDRILRPHQKSRRTPAEALHRMKGIGKENKKYDGAFAPDLLKIFTELKLKDH